MSLNGGTVLDAGNNGLVLTGGKADLHLAVIANPMKAVSITHPVTGLVGGNDYTLTLNTTETATVTGNPFLTLSDGSTATFLGGNGFDCRAV